MTGVSKSECERRVAKLSPREADVLRLMVEGYATKTIAAELEIAEGTVCVYRERIYSKLGVTSLGPAVRVATLGQG